MSKRDPLEMMEAMKTYVIRHEDRRVKSNLARPGRTRSTLPTTNYEPGQPETEAQAQHRERAEFDSNIGDLNRSSVSHAETMQWMHLRIGVADERSEEAVQRAQFAIDRQSDRPSRRELWITLITILAVGGAVGVALGASAVSMVWACLG